MKKELSTLVSSSVQWGCRLDRYTSLGVGGPAAALVRVDRRSELQPLLSFLQRHELPWRAIGRGTNILVKDEGYEGVIILLGDEFKEIECQNMSVGDAVSLRVGGACSLPRLSHQCVELGLTGLEFVSGIPGTVGGAVVMNAGAWNGEIGSLIEAVTITTAGGELRLEKKDLHFTYRCWNDFAAYEGRAVVVEVELVVRQGAVEEVRNTCRMMQGKREQVQPGQYASAGSFFKNPPRESAGRLIDACGLKGFQVGGAMISEKHGNFLVNTGDATASDILNLMKITQEKVREKSGINLEPEVHFL